MYPLTAPRAFEGAERRSRVFSRCLRFKWTSEGKSSAKMNLLSAAVSYKDGTHRGLAELCVRYRKTHGLTQRGS